jgi:hypothetical protein
LDCGGLEEHFGEGCRGREASVGNQECVPIKGEQEGQDLTWSPIEGPMV